MYCLKCGAEIQDGAMTCTECGAQLNETKFCQHCGAVVDKDCVICPKCGKQIGELKQEQPQVIINNSNVNSNTNTNMGKMPKPKNKWIAFLLCLFLGGVGAHKFYEGKILLGIVYIFTGGLLLVGWVFDLIALLFKPNPYFV